VIPETFHSWNGRGIRRAAFWTSAVLVGVWFALLTIAGLLVWGVAELWEAM